MTTSHLRRTGALAALTLTLGMGLAACGSNDSSTTAASSKSTTASAMPSAQGADNAGANTFGPGCKLIPADGKGSFNGMATDPVATAASNNPLLTTLVAAVSGKLNPKVNLVDTLNGGKFTVFAPVDAAFAQLPKKTVTALSKPANADTLQTVLTYHVVPGRLSPSQVTGSHKTVEGAPVKVTGSGDNLMVNDAHVICGGVQTANATVYLIDSVLMPPK